MPNTFHIKKLENYFGNHSNISIDELHQFYKEDEPELKRSTLRWRIYELINKGVLQRIKRGVYTIETEKEEWKPEISDSLKNIYSSIQDEFPYLKLCVWTTQWLVPYSHHLPAGYLTIVYTERETEESVFNFISREFKFLVLLTPSKKEMNTYLDWKTDNVIVEKLISQSPLIEVDGIHIPSLEKIIIDLLSNEVVFDAFQGNELKTIYLNLFTKFSINEGTLKRYAMRRNKWDKFKAALKRMEMSNYLTEDA